VPASVDIPADQPTSIATPAPASIDMTADRQSTSLEVQSSVANPAPASVDIPADQPTSIATPAPASIDMTADRQSTSLEVQPSSSNRFLDYVTIPQRPRATRKRKRMPSYNLTSDDHISFIGSLSESKQKKGKEKQRKDDKNETKKDSKAIRQPARGKTCDKAKVRSKKVKKPTNNREKAGNAKKKAVDVKDTVPCGVCQVRCCDDVYQKNWIKCQQCLVWYHYDCQGLDDNTPVRTFICVSCDD